MLEPLGAAVLLHDDAGRITFATPGTATLLGTAAHDLVGSAFPLRSRLPAQPGDPNAVHRATVRHTTPDGTERRLLVVRRRLGTHQVAVSMVELDEDDALVEAERRLEHATGLTGMALWTRDLATGTLTWSPEMNGLCGLDPDTAPPTPEQWWSWVHPDDRVLVEEAEAAHGSGETEWTFAMRVVPPDGRTRHLRSWSTIEHGPDGAPVRISGATMDVTLTETAVRQLTDSREELRLAFDEAPTGMALVEVAEDGTTSVVRANRSLNALFGLPDDGRMPPADVVRGLGGSAAADFARTVEQLLAGGTDRVSHESTWVRPDGTVGHIDVHASIAPRSPGRPAQLILHVTDVTGHHQAQLEMHRLAMSDPITGLDNRTQFEHRLRAALAQAVPGRRAVAMLLLDLDRFKVVNDSLGHVTGDRLLVEVAARIAETAPVGTCVARLGGDEFAIVIDPAPSHAALLGLAHLLRERLARPYTLDGDVVVCTSSIGVTRVDDPASSAEDVYREADLALYEAKDAGRNGCQISDERMRAKADARREAENRLRAALEADGVRIHLQPVVRLDGGSAGEGTADGAEVAGAEVDGAEALARLEHPVHGLLMPVDFIEAAEDTGLIVDVDIRVAELAVAHLARHADAPPWVAVNASPRTLAQPQYWHRLRSVLEAFAVDPSRLHVEITERSLLDGSASTVEGLETLHALGIAVGIDDFGTGYSALAYLDRFALDFLKIDKTFVARLTEDDGPRAESVVSAIVALAHVYGMKVTAEGVETQAQADALRRVGCDRGQGWFFGRPAPPA